MGGVGIYVLVLLLSAPLGLWANLVWMTNTTEPWFFSCSSDQTIKIIDSAFETYDRWWNFSCIDAPTQTPVSLTNCEWSGYVNQPLGYLHYQCHNDAIITGIASEYFTQNHDRMFRFQCCEPGNYVTHACEYTSYINKYREVLYYRVPDDYVIRGIDSEYQNSYDRLWRFDICKLDQIYTPEI